MSIALELETDQILVASARATGRTTEFQHAFAIPIADNSDASIAESLKTQLAKLGLAKSEATIIVHRASVEIRELDLPPAPDNELPEMVRLIAKNEFASLNDNWLLDFVPLSSNPNLPRKVLATGLSPERHRQLNKIAEAAGLKIKHIILRPFASYDLIRSTLTGNQPRLIIDRYSQQADMIITAGSNVVATRTVRMPATDDTEQLNKTLLSEIKRTLASSRGSLGDQTVSEIIVLGDSDSDRQLSELLVEQLNLDVKVVRPFELLGVPAQFKLPADAARYSPLLGALTQQGTGDRHTIDYLNPRRPVIEKKDFSRTYLYGGIAAAAALLALLFCWWTLRSQAAELATLNQQLMEAVEKNKGDKDNPSVEQTMGEIAKLDDWKLSDVNWLDEIYEYSERFLTPDDAIVDDFDVGVTRNGEPQIVVKGRAAGTSMESAIVESLNERPYAQVELGSSGQSFEDESYASIINLKLEPAVDRQATIRKLDETAMEFLKNQNTPRRQSTAPTTEPIQTPSASE